MTSSTLVRPVLQTVPDVGWQYAEWMVTLSDEDVVWAEIDEIAPTDDQLRRLADVFHAPDEWLQE